MNNNLSNINSKDTNNNLAPFLLFTFRYETPENFTILNLKKPEEKLNLKDKTKKVTEVKKQILNDKKESKENNSKNNNNIENNNIISNNLSTPVLDPNLYNIQQQFDEKGNDITPLQIFNTNTPMIVFIQKKLISEDKSSNSFLSSLLTVGAYICFINTTHFKYISLYPFISESMKSVFKVSKVKGNSTFSQEDSLALNSSISKKEKDFINFIRTKLDSNTINSQAFDPKDNSVANNKISNSKDSKDKNYLIKQTEFNFSTLYTISIMNGQKNLNSVCNCIALGLKSGTVIVWDVELHCEKYIIKEIKDEITSLIIDENFLTVGSIDGRILIFNLMKGYKVFDSGHNNYCNYPIEIVKNF